MDFKWSILVGKWDDKHARYGYLTNFYTTRVSATSTSPPAVLGEADADRAIHEIDAHNWLNVVIPDHAPNALHVIRILVSEVKQEANLALNINLQKVDPSDVDRNVEITRYVFLHDVKLLYLVSTYGDGVGEGRLNESMTAVFQGSIGPIQNITMPSGRPIEL
jgi:hypothetical protein